MDESMRHESEKGLLEDDDDHQYPRQLKRPYKICLSTFFLVFGIILVSILLSIWTTTTSGTNRLAEKESPAILHCGSTADYARSHGCKFQLWSYSWVPEPCYDQETELEYNGMRDWSFYKDKSGTQEVDVDIVRAGESIVWASYRQHFWHCFYTIKKTLRAATINGTGIGMTNNEIGPDVTHTQHCLTSMLDQENMTNSDIMGDLHPNYHLCYLQTVGPHFDYLPDVLPEWDAVGRIFPSE